MDRKINKKFDFIFRIFINIIVKQNKELLKNISKEFNIDLEYLEQKYIKPNYYLPLIKNGN